MSQTSQIDVGDIVYHITDAEQNPMIVTAVLKDLNGYMYRCSTAGAEFLFFRQELSTEKSLSNLLN